MNPGACRFLFSPEAAALHSVDEGLKKARADLRLAVDDKVSPCKRQRSLGGDHAQNSRQGGLSAEDEDDDDDDDMGFSLQSLLGSTPADVGQLARAEARIAALQLEVKRQSAIKAKMQTKAIAVQKGGWVT